MSDRDPDDERDEGPIDLSPWAAPSPPRGLAGRVLEAVRASGDAELAVVERAVTGRRLRTGARRSAAIIGGFAVAAAAAGALWTLWPQASREAASSGHVVAVAPSKISIGAETTALLGAGADIRWRRDGDLVAVTHAAGNVTYQHRGPARLRITTPAGAVETAGATLHLEVPVNKQIVAGAAGAAIAAVVMIAVYEGKASVEHPGTAPRTVESGGQVALAAPAPVPTPAPPHDPFVAPSEEVERTAAPATPPVPEPGEPALPAGTAVAAGAPAAEKAAERKAAAAKEAAALAGKPAEEIVTLAEAAAKESKWARALSLAEAAVRIGGAERTMNRAHLVAALAACNAGSPRKARVHYADIQDSAKPIVRQRCLSQGIDVEASSTRDPFGTKDRDDVVDPFKSRDDRRTKGGGGMVNPFAE